MRLLVAINGGVGERVTGPEIRGWEMARALGESHEVAVVVHDPPASSRDGIRLIPFTRRRLAGEVRGYDAFVAPVIPPYLFTALRGTSAIAVSDQYDPIHLELSLFEDQRSVARVLGSQRLVRDLQLRFADVIACAGERQRALVLDDLERVGGERGSVSPTVVNVPFGLPEPPSESPGGLLRARFPAIGPDDPLVLWWGKVWKWFDAETAIRAFARVAERRSDARLVISAGRAPKEAFDRSAATAAARTLAHDLGLLDRHVFFLEEWIPYERRHELLHDADIGLTLHAETAEAPFAARARYMDYLWTGLPCVLAHGDEVAGRFGEAGFARLVPAGDAMQAADALLGLIEDRQALELARSAGAALAKEYRWSTLVRPLAAAIEERATLERPVRALTRPLARAVGAYYVRRTVDHALALDPRSS